MHPPPPEPTVVAVIRGSDTVDEARLGLQERFAIDAQQADYVLALQLRRLTRLDVIELQAEAEKLDPDSLRSPNWCRIPLRGAR
jgi:DNA gyrase subunit A